MQDYTGAALTDVRFFARFFGILLPLLLLGACAGKLVLQPAALQTLPGAGAPRVLMVEARGQPTSGSAQPLPAGLQLQVVGSIPQGAVLRPVGREIMVIGEDREEAFVVVQGTQWVGYYLPFERAFLSLRQPVSLSLE